MSEDRLRELAINVAITTQTLMLSFSEGVECRIPSKHVEDVKKALKELRTHLGME